MGRVPALTATGAARAAPPSADLVRVVSAPISVVFLENKGSSCAAPLRGSAKREEHRAAVQRGTPAPILGAALLSGYVLPPLLVLTPAARRRGPASTGSACALRARL